MFMKKIKVSQISIVQFFLSFVIFYFFIGLITFCIGLAYALILEQAGVKELGGVKNHLKNVKWGYGLLGVSFLIISCLTMGFAISFFFRKVTSAITICLTLFLVQAFLIGYYIPVNMVNKKAMQIISWAMPQYAPSRIFQVSWYEGLQVEITARVQFPDGVFREVTKTIDYLKD